MVAGSHEQTHCCAPPITRPTNVRMGPVKRTGHEATKVHRRADHRDPAGAGGGRSRFAAVSHFRALNISRTESAGACHRRCAQRDRCYPQKSLAPESGALSAGLRVYAEVIGARCDFATGRRDQRQPDGRLSPARSQTGSSD